MSPTVAGRVVRLAALCLALVAVRRVSQRSGVTDAEFRARLPGDDVLADPMIEWTRATTLRAAPAEVWPWLVQMGYGRGGWYTSERFDRIVWRIENRSADRILPQWQDLAVDDIVPDGPGYAAYFHVVEVVEHEAIVYRSIRHPYRGHPVDPTDPARVAAVERELVEGGVYLDFSWTFVLRPIGDNSTRLIVRTRANVAPRWARLAEAPLGLVDLYHVSTMFREIARRVESRRREPSGTPTLSL